MDTGDIVIKQKPIENPTGRTDSKITATPRPKRKSTFYLSFNEAREYIQKQHLTSTKKFEEWWDENKPKIIPKAPASVYRADWKGWNDFLGNNNEWGVVKRDFRPYNEALFFVHKLQLSTMNDWLDWCTENEDTMPHDIPKRPDLYYKRDWISWGEWLGNSAVTKLSAYNRFVEENRVSLFYIIQEDDIRYPTNVYTFGIQLEGISALREKWNKRPFIIHRLFWHDSTQMERVKNVIEQYTTPWHGDDKQRICPNINEICWELESILEVTKF